MTPVRLSFRVLDFRGVPIRVHLTFLLLFGFLLWRSGTIAGARTAVFHALIALALFACVGLHEMGHAWVAMRRGILIEEITLYPYGGVARLARRPPTGRAELEIAAAGPLVNLILAGLLFSMTGGAVIGPSASPVLRAGSLLFWANLIIAAFNLLPAFPLDGGRVVRGALAGQLGWTRATIWSASAGQVLSLVLIAAGVVHDPWLLLAGVLLLPGANSELRWALGLRALERSRVHDVMRSDVQLVGPDASLEALAQASREALASEFIVHDGDRATGFLPAARLWGALRSPASSEMCAADAALPLGRPVEAGSRLDEALQRLEEDECDAAPVVDPAGAIVGVITRAALERTRSLTRHLTDRYRSR